MGIDWPQIVHEHGRLVWKTAQRLLFNEADVSDCFQETFVSALEFSKTKSVNNWPGLLRRIAISRSLDRLRRRKKERFSDAHELSDQIPSREADPARQIEAVELSDRLRIALTELPPNQSQAFCLRYLNGLEYEEIAAEMEITVDAAGSLLHRARTRLGELLVGATIGVSKQR